MAAERFPLELIPPESMFELAWWALLVLAGCICVLLGLLLVLVGRHVARVVAALAAAAAGAAAAPLIAQAVGFRNVWVVGLAALVSGGLFGFILARFLWAALPGLALGFAVLAICPGPPGAASRPAGDDHGPQADGLRAAPAASVTAVADWAMALGRRRTVLVVAALLLPVALCVGLELFFPRSVMIFATASAGAVLTVGGARLLARAARWEQLKAWAGRPVVLGAAVGGLALVGVVWQYSRQSREVRRREAAATEGGEGGEAAPAGRPAGAEARGE